MCSSGRVFLNNIKLNVHFSDEEEIGNDLDPADFKSIENHHCLMNYLIRVSHLLDRSVIVTPENLSTCIMVKVDADNIEIPVDVNPPKFPSVPYQG